MSNVIQFRQKDKFYDSSNIHTHPDYIETMRIETERFNKKRMEMRKSALIEDVVKTYIPVLLLICAVSCLLLY